MVKRYDVEGVRSPAGRYSLVGEINPGARLYYLAGQTGTAPDGTSPDGIAAQTTQVYDNIKAILAALGLGLENVAKTTTYLTNPDDIPGWRDAQKAALGDVVPASTLLVISRLARPELLVEVDVVAADD